MTSPEVKAAIRAELDELSHAATQDDYRKIAARHGLTWKHVWGIDHSRPVGASTKSSTIDDNPRPSKKSRTIDDGIKSTTHPRPSPTIEDPSSIQETVASKKSSTIEDHRGNRASIDDESGQIEHPSTTFGCSECLCLFKTDPGEKAPGKCPGCGSVFA